eukprot:7506854-Alexandrium_andersonii.AAC.1
MTSRHWGADAALGWYRKGIQARMSTKMKGRLGPRREDMKEMRVLNRIVTWTDEEYGMRQTKGMQSSLSKGWE